MRACAAGKYSVFGELLSQPSRLAPNAAVDCSVGALVASGLATSATLLCASLLRSATRCAAFFFCRVCAPCMPRSGALVRRWT